jgi:hypothetical protein
MDNVKGLLRQFLYWLRVHPYRRECREMLEMMGKLRAATRRDLSIYTCSREELLAAAKRRSDYAYAKLVELAHAEEEKGK